ncbi:AMP-binding protein [Nocardiopsis sp. CNT312]|uniref:AMP-binding protein n=1 Tax=Nocardiopsis sp. CNT312 TaxID=1137268 RepID=UPI0004BAC223|nr:AMP-binding protein [Nocardiopsis sp. CNT312]
MTSVTEPGSATAVSNAAVSPERAAEYRRRGWWRNTTFLDDLRRQARERPRRTAVAARRGGPARTDVLTYADLERLTDRFAGALLELGVRRGDVVAVRLPDRWEMVPLLFATAAVGAVLCPIAPSCDGKELRHRLDITGARVYITVPEPDGSPSADAEHVMVVDGPVPTGTVGFHEHFVAAHWEERRPGLSVDLALTPDEPFVILFTSGTTGFSKGVVHSQNTVHAGVRGYTDAFLLRDDLVAAVTTPLVHYSGFGQGVLAGVMLGGTVLFQEERDHAGLLDLVERYRATLLYGPPPTLSGIAAAQRAEPRDVSALRYTVTGAAPVLQGLVDELRAAFGTSTYSVWGMSEFGPVTISRLDYDQDWSAHSHGRPIDAAEIRVDRCDDPGRRAPVGRLRVRGASRALGYHGRQKEFVAEIGADGWFDTGDLAREDGRGGIRVLGRGRDAIVRDGVPAPVAEIEALLARHPRVAQAALVGPPDGGAGPITAAVVPRNGDAPTLGEMRAHLLGAGQEARFLPERLAVVASLPTTLTGKVRKAELRECLAGDGPSPPSERHP